jgi:tRNA A-37 threonylcarbamoyl transferase component Bud32/tetratricopeptide (TPR) repeat protein
MRVVRGYALQERIGEGGFATVYRALAPSDQHEVAIKILHPEYARQPQFVKRFAAEAQLIQQLDHRYIVPIEDYWHDDENAALVMPYLRGGSLRSVLRRGALTDESVLRVVGDVAAALMSAHAQGIIHCDLKPDNILLDEHGRAYLADFGIARLLEGDEAAQGGTLRYLAPEQIERAPLTPKTDIYAFGLMTWELLTGRAAYDDADRPTVLSRHLRDPLPDLRALRPDLPDAFQRILQRACAKAPAERYASALDFAAAVQQRLTGGVRAYETRARLLRGDIATTRLFGREALLGNLQAHLQSGGRALLHGFGGVGKTTLAMQVAANMAAAGGVVAWLEVGDGTLAVVLETLVRGFKRYEEYAAMDETEGRAFIAELLGGCALLVLDNVWQDEALAGLASFVPNGLPVLATSRFAPAFDGVYADVGVLERASSLALLGHHSGRDWTGDPDANALCQLLGDHPFALEIAGRNLAAEADPAVLIKRIADAPHELRVPGSFAEAGRESVADLLDVSIGGLGANGRALLTAMGGMFTPRASVELIGGVLAWDDSVLQAALAELIAFGLAEGRQVGDIAHYQLHDLTYAYARAMYRRGQREHSAHIAAALAYVQRYIEAGDYTRLEFELANLLAAGQHAYDEGQSSALVQMMMALVVQGDFFNARGANAVTIDLLRLAIRAAKARRDVEAAHYLLGKLGNFYGNFLGDLNAAFEAYSEEAQLAKMMGNNARRAISLGSMSWALTLQGEEKFSEAERLLDAAYKIALTEGDKSLLAHIFEYRGLHKAIRSQFEGASADFGNAARFAEEATDKVRQFYAMVNWAKAELDTGHLPLALQLARQACNIAQLSGNERWISQALENAGEILSRLRRRRIAQRLFDQAWTTYRKVEANADIRRLKVIMLTEGYDIPEEIN